MHHQAGPQKGMSLVEVMVATVILAIAGVGITALVGRTFTVQRNLDRLGQSEIIRRTLRTEFDCRKTLRVSPFKRLPQKDACPVAAGKTLEILGRDGNELFSLHVSGEFYRVGDWQIKATCDKDMVRFEGRVGSASRVKSEADANFGGWRDLFAGTAQFCREYLSAPLNSCSDPQYPLQVGWDSRGAHCCRVQEDVKKGKATAACSRFEILVSGGAMCGQNSASLGPVSVKRNVIKGALLGPGLGTTKSTKTTIAVPGVPHFLFPNADIIANIIGPWENATVPRGGFLAKSLPTTNDSTPGAGVLDRWEAQCKSDDYNEDWTTRAAAVCCPRRL